MLLTITLQYVINITELFVLRSEKIVKFSEINFGECFLDLTNCLYVKVKETNGKPAGFNPTNGESEKFKESATVKFVHGSITYKEK